jgi:hypothetical protein
VPLNPANAAPPVAEILRLGAQMTPR